MTTYRACYYVWPDSQSSVCLTGPEHAHLSDDDLIALAIAEAHRPGCDLIDPDGPSGLTGQDVRDGLSIGDWDD